MAVAVQLVGSLLILLPFLLSQRGLMSLRSMPYLALNLVGSTVLAADAAHGRQWGFLLLEGVWALVSLQGLVQLVRGREPGAATEPRRRLRSGGRRPMRASWCPPCVCARAAVCVCACSA